MFSPNCRESDAIDTPNSQAPVVPSGDLIHAVAVLRVVQHRVRLSRPLPDPSAH